jgi:hypothetical protein
MRPFRSVRFCAPCHSIPPPPFPVGCRIARSQRVARRLAHSAQWTVSAQQGGASKPPTPRRLRRFRPRFLRPRACILSSPAAATRQAERRSSGDAAAVGVRAAPGTAAPRWRRCSCVLRGLFVPLRRASAPVEVTRPLRAVGDSRSASALPTAASPSSAAARSPKRHFTHSSSTMLHTVDTGTHSESCGVLRASGRHASARAQTQKPP